MSFDIFLICTRDGEIAHFKRSLFEEIFTREAVDPRLPLTEVTYRDGGGAQIDCDGEDEIDNMSFSHCGGATFFAALHELADRSGSLITWPAEGRSLAVTQEAVTAHLPDDMEELGPPYVVANGQELAACILGSDGD